MSVFQLQDVRRIENPRDAAGPLQKRLALERVVPGRADDDEVVAGPVDALVIPHGRRGVDAELTERLGERGLVGVELRQLGARGERDPWPRPVARSGRFMPPNARSARTRSAQAEAGTSPSPAPLRRPSRITVRYRRRSCVRALPVAHLDRRHELEHERQVVDLDAGAQGVPNALEEGDEQRVRPLGEREHLLGRRERAGEGERHRTRVRVDEPLHEVA